MRFESSREKLGPRHSGQPRSGRFAGRISSFVAVTLAGTVVLFRGRSKPTKKPAAAKPHRRRRRAGENRDASADCRHLRPVEFRTAGDKLMFEPVMVATLAVRLMGKCLAAEPGTISG